MSESTLKEKIEYELDGYIPEINEFNKVVDKILALLSQELSIVEKKAKIEGAEMLFQAIDAEYKSFVIDVGIGQILQKVRDALSKEGGTDE